MTTNNNPPLKKKNKTPWRGDAGVYQQSKKRTELLKREGEGVINFGLEYKTQVYITDPRTGDVYLSVLCISKDKNICLEEYEKYLKRKRKHIYVKPTKDIAYPITSTVFQTVED